MPSARPALLRVRLIDGLAAEVDGRRRELPQSRRGKALLAWLALNPGVHPRTKVAGTFWPDVLEQSARASLRVALTELRKALGPAVDGSLVATRTAVGLPDAWVDVGEMERLAEQGRLAEAVGLGQGELLRELDEDWVYEARDRHRERVSELLGRLTAEAQSAGDLETAVRWSRRRVELEPQSEQAAAELIRLLTATGDHGAAVTTYERLRERLRISLGIAPSPETRGLVGELPKETDSEAPQLGPAALSDRFEALLERSSELEAIDAAITEAVSGSGRLVHVEGPAGIGKSSLLEAAQGIASAGGMHVLTARGSELEREFGFGVVRQLFERALADPEVAAWAFEGEAGFAGRLFDVGPDPPDAGPETAFAALHGLQRLTANLSDRRPLALLIDDAHWSDPASLRFLSFLAHRLLDMRVLVVAASRPSGESGGSELVPLAMSGGPATVLRLRPLTEAGTTKVVRQALGDANEDLCRACHAAARGNPFFLRELVRSLSELERPRAEAVGEIVPGSVALAVQARIAGLPDRARELAKATALVGAGALLRVAAEVAGLDVPTAAEAADVLASAGVLRNGRPLAFQHPLVRTAVYESIPSASRTAAHRFLARLLASEGAPPERVAAQLTAAEPESSEWACEQLMAAAREATRRAAPEAAVGYLRRALDEPPASALRAGILLELGSAEAASLATADAIEHLRLAMDATPDADARLRVALLLASLLSSESRAVEGVDCLDRALEDGRDADPDLRSYVEAHLVSVSRMSLGARVRASDHPQRLRDRVEDGAADRPAELAGVAVEMVMTGESAERAAELAERAIERLQLAPAPVGDYTVLQAARALVAAGKLKAAERTLTDVLEDGRRRGAYFLASVAVAFRAEARYHAGSLAGAEADARDALAFYEEAWPTGVPGVTSTLVRTLLDLGRRDEADAAIAQADLWGPPGSFPDDYTCNVLLFSRGELYLARQEWQLALDDLTESGRRQEAMGEHNPALVPWRSTAARALAELGRRDEALALANEELKLSRAFGAPRPLGLSLRAAALLEDSDRRLELLREAVEVLNTAGAQVEHARALAELGATLRAQGREDAALEALRASLYLSQESGAAPIEDQANDELRVSGARR